MISSLCSFCQQRVLPGVHQARDPDGTGAIQWQRPERGVEPHPETPGQRGAAHP